MMAITLFGLFFILPALSGYIANILSSRDKKLWWYKRLRRIKRWKKPEYSAATFIVATVAFYALGLSAIMGNKSNTTTALTVLSINCLSAFVFLYYHWNISAFIARHWELCKTLITPVVVCVATLSKIYSDAAIAELSSLSPADLPGTQLFLTLILTPTIWFFAASLAFGYASLLLIPALLVKNLVDEYRRNNKKHPLRKKKKSSPAMAIVALSLGAIILLTLMQKVASKSFYEPRLRQAIAFSSFHLPTSYCGLEDTNGVNVAVMPDDRAALAIPDVKLGYKFIKISCSPPRTTDSETKEILKNVINENNKTAPREAASHQ